MSQGRFERVVQFAKEVPPLVPSSVFLFAGEKSQKLVTDCDCPGIEISGEYVGYNKLYES